MNDLTAPMEEMTRVVSLVAAGDLRQTMPLETGGFRLQGQFMRTAEIVNNMVGQLNEFSSEVTRVAREVGSAGKLGGQAKAAGVSGTQGNRTSE
jgi:methyl-accepting chemotaxis protein